MQTAHFCSSLLCILWFLSVCRPLDAMPSSPSPKQHQHQERKRMQGTRQRIPQVIIIGVKKSGTRALLEFLRLHPLISGPGPETHFFDRFYGLGYEWYRRQMPPTTAGQLTVEKTPNYFVHRQVPARIHRMYPKTRLLLIVRNPVTRAISDYTQSVSKKRSSKPFDRMACIDQNCTVIDTSWSAIKIGLYSKHVKRWLRYFPLDQMHVVSGERLITDPLQEVRQVERFLQLPPFIRQDHFFYNSSKGFPCIKKPNHSTYHCLGKNKGRTHLPVSETTLVRLKTFYAPFNKKFYDIVGRNFDW